MDKFSNTMDDDLWGPASALVAQDDTCCLQTARGCEFYFDYRLDVIEENALNERSCVQALKILIKKEDAEIDELERVLVLFQNDLAWPEHDDWPDICCKVVREKIDLLDKYLRTLKKADAEDSEIQSLLREGPAERLHTMLKALLENYCQAKDKLEQTHDAIPLDGNIGSRQSTLDEDAITSNISDAETIESGDPLYGIDDRGPDTALKLQETTVNDSETVQPAGEVELTGTDGSKETVTKNWTIAADSESPIKSKEPTTTLAKDSATNINRDDVRYPNETRDHLYGIEDRGPDTALKLRGTTVDGSETVQPAGEAELTRTDSPKETNSPKETISENWTVSADTESPIESKELTTTLAEDSAASINRDNDRHLNENQISRNSNSSSLSKPGEYQYSAADTSKLPPALRQGKYGSPDLRSLVSKAKQKLRGKTNAPAEKTDSSSFSPREDEERRKDHHQTVSFQDILTATEPFTIEGLLEMCDELDKGREASHDKEDKVSRSGTGHVAETATTVKEEEPIPNFLLEPQRIKLETENNAELISTSMQSPVSASTKKRGHNENRGSNKSFNRNVKQKVIPVPDKQGDTGQMGKNPGDTDGQNPTKKTKKGELKRERKSSTHILNKSEISKSDLKEMTANELRAMAKQLKVRLYYKLNKSDLVEQLTNRASPSQLHSLIVQSGRFSISWLPQ